ncbi:hypothetical protein [Allocoleopsis sp.]|uniref:hypothetical protein n=1 Tax=Allocoleopsis sp. TaxID=3088169 RepID=UPI002FD01DD6
MKLKDNLDLTTSYLQETLVGYEIIPANFGWHIHKEDTYCGLLQYQETKGWQGTALTYLPLELREQLQRFDQLHSSSPFLAA